jgi:hypothetical protein
MNTIKVDIETGSAVHELFIKDSLYLLSSLSNIIVFLYLVTFQMVLEMRESLAAATQKENNSTRNLTFCHIEYIQTFVSLDSGEFRWAKQWGKT